jgi:putative membrane protein
MMNQSSGKSVVSGKSTIPRLLDQLLNGAFLVTFSLVWLKIAFGLPALEKLDWLEGALLFLAAVCVVTAVSRTLPFQNVLWGAVVIGCIGGMAHAIGFLASIPFGPYVYTPAAGSRIFGLLPWAVPLVWILFIYTSRGVARLILKPWRKTRVYGFWLMGLTVVLSVILDLGMDPFASRLKHYWIWEPTRFPYDWHGTPFTNFVGWIVTAAFVMVFVTPMLINKKPGTSITEYRSSAVWTLLNVLFVTVAVTHGFWLAAGVVSVGTAAALIFAVRGARW